MSGIFIFFALKVSSFMREKRNKTKGKKYFFLVSVAKQSALMMIRFYDQTSCFLRLISSTKKQLWIVYFTSDTYIKNIKSNNSESNYNWQDKKHVLYANNADRKAEKNISCWRLVHWAEVLFWQVKWYLHKGYHKQELSSQQDLLQVICWSWMSSCKLLVSREQEHLLRQQFVPVAGRIVHSPNT